MREAFRAVPGLVDVDSTLNPTAPKLVVAVDREKAALHGVAPAHVVQTLAAAGYGAPLGAFHVERGASQVPLVLQLAPAQRSRLDTLLSLTVPGARGQVPLSELVRVERTREAAEIQHKNLKPVAYVTADLAGEIESPVYALLALEKKLEGLRGDRGEPVARYGLAHPADTRDARAQVGRRVAHHARGLPRPRPRLRGGDAAHLRAHGRLVPELHDADRDPRPDPAVARRHPAGARARRHVLHRDQHDRLHRRAPASWSETGSSSWTSPS